MALTCLQIIQSVCKRVGIASPSFVVASSDLQILQILELANEEGQELANRSPWQALQTETTFTTVATQVQGTLATIAPNCDYIVNNTIWNRSLRRPIYGSKTEQDWQQAKALASNAPYSSYRVFGDSINFYPVPVAGQTCAFEYVTRNWVTTASSTSATWTADTDTPKLNDQLIILGTIWRWKHAKGLDYSEDFAKYERRVVDAVNRDASKPILSMEGGAGYDINPVVIIPAGSW
jgi:hypothetical protein